MNKSIILVIDAGSSSIRCTGWWYEYHGNNKEDIHDIDNNDINNAQFSSPLVTAMDGISHTISMPATKHTTGHIHIRQVLSTIDECVDKVLSLLRSTQDTTSSNDGYQIVALGFSTFVMNLVGVDVNGDPVSDVATCSYACNRDDVVRECQALRDNLGPKRLSAMYQRTGTPLHVSYALPQLLAFYKNDSNAEIAKQIHKWQTISSICLYRWCGRPQSIQMPISYSEASWTGMLNFRTCTWDDDTVNVLSKSYQGSVQQHNDQSEDDDYQDDDIHILPPLVDFDESLSFLRGGIPQYNDDGSTNNYWERWPEMQNPSLRMFLGIGDGAAANIGSKCGTRSLESDVQRIACTIGTSAAARVCLPLPLTAPHDDSITVPPGLFCYRVNKDAILLGGALTDGGSVVEWARNLFNLQSTESFETCLSEVTSMYERRCCGSPSVSGSLAMVPFLTGERSTGYRSGARGCISGLTRETTSVDIMYSCLESVILRLSCILRLIDSVCSSQKDKVLVASGNALENNTLWRQMLADCSAMNVIVDAEANEGTSRGIAMLMASSIRQEYANNRLIEEPLVIQSETAANIQAKQYWEEVSSTQESLIDTVNGPSLFS